MIVGIVGLGLIGGSLAKAFRRDPSVYVLGTARTKKTTDFALLAGDIDGVLTPDRLAECDLVLLAAFPEACIEYLRDNAALFSKTGIVMDCCGTKADICAAAFPLAEEHGFTFLGGHPMAGTQFSGLKYARATLFDGAPMVVVPPRYDDIALLDRVKRLLAPLGFRSISVTTAEAHDAMIAFTSQLCHVVSNAYIKSPTARRHSGFSAGSYRDLTRVARLNPEMWAELMLENRQNMLFELDTLIGNLTKYRAAIEAGDEPALRALLDEGRRIKEEIDG